MCGVLLASMVTLVDVVSRVDLELAFFLVRALGKDTNRARYRKFKAFLHYPVKAHHLQKLTCDQRYETDTNKEINEGFGEG